MAGKVLINLATGLEDPERVTVAFLVGGAAVARGDKVAIWMTKEAVRLALPGHALGVACEGCPPLAKLFEQFRGWWRRTVGLSDLLYRPSA
jgi:predicted peroxiredoxin